MSSPITSFDSSTLQTFPATLGLLREQGLLTPTVTLDRLGSLLSPAQRAVVDQVMELDPRDYGVHTPYAGDLEPVPADLVTVVGQQYTDHGQQQTKYWNKPVGRWIAILQILMSIALALVGEFGYRRNSKKQGMPHGEDRLLVPPS